GNTGGLDDTPGAWVNGADAGVGVNANGAEADTDFGGANNYRSMFGLAGVELATTTGTTAGNATNVAYKADVVASQRAGVYQNQIEYIVTAIYQTRLQS